MDWLTTVEHEGHALSVAARHDTTATVPSCPGWTVDDLLRHVSTVHRWATDVIRAGSVERTDPPTDAPPHGGSLAWYEAGLAVLVETFRASDPAAPIWTFDANNRTVSFWHRRQAHETTVHRVDAQLATGGVTPVDTELAVDGIAESLGLFVTRTAKRSPDLVPASGTVHLHTTDAEGEWLVTFGSGAVGIETGHAKGDAAVRGAAADLYLWLWGRAPVERLEVFGDADLAGRLQRLAGI